MTPSDVARRVRESSGDIAVLQFSNATLTDWINDSVRECAVENSLLQQRLTQNLVINQADYVLPSDIFKFHSVLVDGMKLEMLTREEWEQRHSGPEADPTQDKGTPRQCYVYAGVLTLWPIPDAVKPLLINYTKFPASIAYSEPGGTPTWTPNVISIPEQYHNRIVSYCQAQVALQDDNYDKYAALMLEFSTGTKQLNDSRHEDDLYPSISVSPRDMGEYFPYDLRW